MTILDETHHSLIIIEYDPFLYEGLTRDGRICLTGQETGFFMRPQCCYTHLESIPFQEDLAVVLIRVFYSEEGPRDTPRLTAKIWLKMKDQRTLEAFS